MYVDSEPLVQIAFSPGRVDSQPGVLCLCPRLCDSRPELELSAATGEESPARRLNHLEMMPWLRQPSSVSKSELVT